MNSERPHLPGTVASRSHWPWLVLIVLLGGALRFHGLDAQSFWYDELATIGLSAQPPGLLWSDWMVRETNPPLYYTLVHYWRRAFGDSEAGVRSLSALLGSTVPLLLFLLGRRLASVRAGLIAAALSAVATLQFAYSQEARSYILATVATLVAVLGLSQLADRLVTPPSTPPTRPGRLLPWLLYVAGCVIALYSHTTMVLLPLLANLYVLWLWRSSGGRDREWLLRWAAANGLCLLLWLWWASLTLQQMAFPRTNYAWISRPSLLDALHITREVYLPIQWRIWANVVPVLILGAALRGLFHLRKDRRVLLCVFGLGVPLLLFVISQKVPIFLVRTMLWAQFALLLAVAVGLASLPGWRQGVAVFLVLAVFGLDVGGWLRWTKKEPWRETIAALQRHVGPQDVVLVSSAAIGAAFHHYCRPPACQTRVLQLLVPDDEPNRWAHGLFHGPVLRPEELPAVLARYERVYTLARNTDDPRAYVQPLADQEPETSLGAPSSPTLSIRVWRPRQARVDANAP